jgi:ATP-binding cassette, subfamily G (WHITE), member 2
VWDRERILLRREVGQGMYSIPAWFGAKTVVNWPVQLLQVLLFGTVAFFGVGYAITASNFLTYLASYALFQLTAESVGIMCAAVTKNSTMAILVLTFVLLILLSFSGFLVSAVPIYFKWVRTISFLTYAYNAAVLSEFGSIEFTCETGPPACPEAGAVYPGRELLPANISQSLSVGVNLAILLGITLVTRVLAFLSVWGAHKLHFL